VKVPPLNTDLAEALADLDRRRDRAGPQFAAPANVFRKVKTVDKVNRAGIRNLIRPENAATILQHLPTGAGERLHALLRGDFVLFDLIPAIVAEFGPVGHLRIATLGLSAANAQGIARLVTTGQVERVTLVVSHYFQQVDRTTVYAEVCAALAPVGIEPVVTRNHAKVILLPFLGERAGRRHFLVIEGSANLRSSDNLEQIVVFNDADSLDFHAAWIDDLVASQPRPALPALAGEPFSRG
jgi:hypothetical protein